MGLLVAGRIRSIKPEILDDEKAAQLSDIAWRLWVSSWLLADDHGRFRASPMFLHAQAFWGRPRTVTEVEGAIGELHDSGLIQVYVVNAQVYAAIPNWSRHQRIDNAAKPRCPEPTPAAILREAPRTSAVRRLTTDLRSPISDPEEDPEGDARGGFVSPGKPVTSVISDFEFAEGTKPVHTPPEQPKRGRKPKPKASDPTPDETPAVERVLAKLSDRAKRTYRPTTTAWAKLVVRLLRDGYTETQMRTVIWHQANEWESDPRMQKFLRPSTLFGPEKFPEYLAEAEAVWAESEPKNKPRGDPAPSAHVMALLNGKGAT